MKRKKETSVILYDDPNSLSWKIKHDNLFSDRVITENNLKNIGKANAISFINPPNQAITLYQKEQQQGDAITLINDSSVSKIFVTKA